MPPEEDVKWVPVADLPGVYTLEQPTVPPGSGSSLIRGLPSLFEGQEHLRLCKVARVSEAPLAEGAPGKASDRRRVLWKSCACWPSPLKRKAHSRFLSDK
jgi:hypothetical protein